jgi:L-malate glycosyltransferase
MKLGFITPEYPHPEVKHSAGIGTSIHNLVQALTAQEIQVTVFVYGQSKQTIIKDGLVTLHLVEDLTVKYAKWYFNRKHIQRYIERVCIDQKIDLLEAPDWTGITAFMRFSIPLVIRFHGSDTYFCYLEKRKQKFKNYFFEKIAIKGAKGYIAPTEFAGKISSELFKIDSRKIQTIHYGLELNNFINKTPLVYDQQTILYIGTIIRKKGVFELPEIFHLVRKQFPLSKLVLIGNDASDVFTGSSSSWKLLTNLFYKEDLEEVTYLGKIPYQEVKEYIKKADVCVFPTYAETLGMVTIESMALQKPVVNSNIGWANELIVDGESGFLVHPSNHIAFASRIVTLFKDTDLRNKIGLNAQKRAISNFDIHKIVHQNISFYQNLIKK